MGSLSSTLSLYTGMSAKEIDQDVSDKAKILSWMVKKGYKEINAVGAIVSQYYMNPEEITAMAARNAEWHGRA
ncbi:Uncharacterised protein [uncultured archaeon]|nr:Uncharacterised protein [uncultured archaeon]